jgi:cytochrome c oxidase cbb3-type subunit I/II
VKEDLDRSNTVAKMEAMRTLGVPYDKELDAEEVNQQMDEQAAGIVASLKKDDISEVDKDKEIVALIAYLQRLGTDIKGSEASTADTDYTEDSETEEK